MEQPSSRIGKCARKCGTILTRGEMTYLAKWIAPKTKKDPDGFREGYVCSICLDEIRKSSAPKHMKPVVRMVIMTGSKGVRLSQDTKNWGIEAAVITAPVISRKAPSKKDMESRPVYTQAERAIRMADRHARFLAGCQRAK